VSICIFIFSTTDPLMTPVRMYDRGVGFPPQRETDDPRYRIETLVGITGMKMAKYRSTWREAVFAPFKLFWRPHLLSVMIFEVIRYLPLG
jgi:hypothetical protein